MKTLILSAMALLGSLTASAQLVSITQSNTSNSATATQFFGTIANPNDTDINQNGNYNDADTFQWGLLNVSDVDQIGNSNTSTVFQDGMMNMSTVLQNGNSNTSSVSQTGTTHMSTVTQNGNGNGSTVTQNN